MTILIPKMLNLNPRLLLSILALCFHSSTGSTIRQQQVLPINPAQGSIKSRAPGVVIPHLCPDNTTQYSGYLPNSPLFFWFFPSRSDPSTDPIGIWSNGGPGSSALTGMQYAGPCRVIEKGDGQGLGMEKNEWSFNDEASILMIDNPKGAGFSYSPFPATHSVYDSAIDTYQFLQEFMQIFPEYQSHEFAYNSLSYGGHYAPAYASYIQHMNAQVLGIPSLWSDIWPRSPSSSSSESSYIPINLTTISIGNGWINGRVQYRALVDFACGHPEAEQRGLPMMGNKEDCDWASKRLTDGEALLDRCKGGVECAAAGQYSEAISAFPYQQANLNPYDYRTSAPYPESEIIAFYNNATVQAAIGVISSPQQEAKVWDTHSARVHAEFTFGETGDWNGHTDGLVERLLRSGVGVLKYEGMVDWICNYIGIRKIMANLPNYSHQSEFNELPMLPWLPYPLTKTQKEEGADPGAYKCLRGKKSEGNLCYVEIEGAGHILSLDKPREGSLMIRKWMRDKML